MHKRHDRKILNESKNLKKDLYLKIHLSNQSKKGTRHDTDNQTHLSLFRLLRNVLQWVLFNKRGEGKLKF